MRKLPTIRRSNVTPGGLLRQASEIPADWVGLCVAAWLLTLSGWRASGDGPPPPREPRDRLPLNPGCDHPGGASIQDGSHPGRLPGPPLDVARRLATALGRCPAEVEVQRSRWNGLTVAESLRTVCGFCLQPSPQLAPSPGFSAQGPSLLAGSSNQKRLQPPPAEAQKTSGSPERVTDRGRVGRLDRGPLPAQDSLKFFEPLPEEAEVVSGCLNQPVARDLVR